MKSNADKFGPPIGRGGFGLVYSVNHPNQDRHIAMKVTDNSHPNMAAREAFFLAMGLPGVPELEGYAQDVNSRAHLLGMTLLNQPEYEDLSKLIGLWGSLNPVFALAILQQITSLFSTWRADHNVVHLDVKPSNIMVDKMGQIQFIDWGMAAKLDHPDHKQQPQGIVGTLSYLSPEQIKNPLIPTESTQAYTLAVIMFEMLTGRRASIHHNVNDLVSSVYSNEPIHNLTLTHEESFVLEGQGINPHLLQQALNDATALGGAKFNTLNEFFTAVLRAYPEGVNPNNGHKHSPFTSSGSVFAPPEAATHRKD